MNFVIPEELKEQMLADSIKFIHIRDGVSVDVQLDGSYTTDFDFDGPKVVLRDEYISKMNTGMKNWFNSLTSDSSFYRFVDGDCINIHGEELEDFCD